MNNDFASHYITGIDLDKNNFFLLQNGLLGQFLWIVLDALKKQKLSSLRRDLKALFKKGKTTITNLNNNAIFTKNRVIKAQLSIAFSPNSTGCKIYLGKNLRGSINIKVNNSNSLIYIGNNCELNNLEILSFQDFDEIIVGNHVTTSNATTNKITFISGGHAGESTPYLVIGDDCMFSYGITIRNTDAHPIISLLTDNQINSPVRGVLIEPHVWIGQDASILKDVTIGCGSIIGMGAIVTKDVPCLSVAVGVPASYRKLGNKLWVRSNSEQANNQARAILEKYVGFNKEVETSLFSTTDCTKLN